MPVTAKLSRKFYETFGDEIANELVEWFNAVDATYRAELRELNELNFSRFDAKLEQQLATYNGQWERRLAESDIRWERRLAEFRSEFRTELSEIKAEMVKWMFIFVTGSTFTVIGVLTALLKL